jgi:AAA domain
MATFQKPQPLKAALKLGLYGPAGSGKTFTALLIAEGLARHTGKRVAFCDIEQGTAFYGQEVAQRAVHPEAFDFDVLHTRAITETLAAVKGLDLDVHGVLVVDSISHLWDSCKNAFTGRLTRAGTVPLHAWGTIKKPYKELMHLLLSLPVHVLICGWMGIDYAEDEASGELKNMGYKMRAEGETAYEPDILLRQEFHKASRKEAAVPVAHVEKDRTGILSGKTISWPTFDNVARPLLGLLGTTQVAVPTDDQVGMQDAEALARQEAEWEQRSAELTAEYTTRFAEAGTVATLERIGKELTQTVKALLAGSDLARVRKAYGYRPGQLRAEDHADPGTNGQTESVATA